MSLLPVSEVRDHGLFALTTMIVEHLKMAAWISKLDHDEISFVLSLHLTPRSRVFIMK